MLCSKCSGKKKKTVKIICIIIIVLSLLFITCSLALKWQGDTYYGDGFEINYNSYWIVGELENGKEAIINKKDGSYIALFAKASLSELNNKFDTDADRKNIYNSLYNLWGYAVYDTSMSQLGGSDGFTLLKDDMYYSYINYGHSTDKLEGRHYFIISKENDTLISFITRSTLENFDKNNKDYYKMLKTLKITSDSNQ
ncbi:MAG: hypothetical protein GX758_03820 [Tenericutes bacterium]|nr:hypothetical protein [Mycoplasmatota bacterium]